MSSEKPTVPMILVNLLLAMTVPSVTHADWCELEPLKDAYEKARGTAEAAYAHQYLCMLEKSCEEYRRSVSDGWAGGFVKSTFSYQRALEGTHRGIDVDCPKDYSDSQCFTSASGIHGTCELIPSFTNYCDEITELDSAAYDEAVEKWTDDHETFLEKAFEPCFEEVLESGELPGEEGRRLKDAYESLARTARKGAQTYCESKTSDWGFLGKVADLAQDVQDKVMCRK